MAVVLLSNNPRLGTTYPGLVKGPALTVLLAGLALVRAGYRLFNHPLYGNIQPERQPYRSLIFVGESGGSVHQRSLQLMEEAAARYRRVPAPDWEVLPPAVLEDWARLDYELIRGPLAEAGWPGESPEP